jgi:peptidoglycan-associated lipoprotein
MSIVRTASRIAATALAAAALAALGACAGMGSGREHIVRAPTRCADQAVQVYFEPQSAEVTKEGRAVIAAAAQGAAGCRIASVDVLGLADAAGAPGASLELSKKRAESVADALKAAGLPAAQYQVAAAGQAGAVTGDGKTQPMRRRVDIVLHEAPK